MSLRNCGRILAILLLLLLEVSWAWGKPQQIKPGCRYEGRRYQEGTSVSTSEPCLQCRCTEGALRCRLRVCPRLPSPPPFGCHVRSPGENVCCPELLCGEARDTENTLRWSNGPIPEEEVEEENPQNSRSEGCLHEGVRYGPGSAMMGSRRCEYCYCISGARRCIRPKCLLPLPGCTALYAPHACCPVAYNCTRTDTSTFAPITGNGCRVGERIYAEGEMVRDIEWKAGCDNCFCAMGAVRCVPLACAPPLQGCSPIVREGHCCPSTYNCSGSIEVKATQNYASYAFISKDYAKFRKETNFFPAMDQTTTLPIEGRGHRVVEERISATSTMEDDCSVVTDSTSYPSTFETDVMDNEILIETVDYMKSSLEITTTTATLFEELTTNVESTTLESTSPSSRDEDSVVDSWTTCSTITVEESTITMTEDFSSVDSTTYESTTMPSGLIENSSSEEVEEEEKQKNNVIERKKGSIYPSTISANQTEIVSSKQEDSRHTNFTMDSVVTIESIESVVKGHVTKPSSTILMPDDILVMNVTVKTNVSVGHIQGITINPIRTISPDIEAILNITHREKGEDYDYDYSDPTLPPSLPNVRIIPFVAADALVKDKTVPLAVTGYPSGSAVVPPELRPTDTSGFYDIATQENRFSPPVETEGGFVPREPSYFDAPYHSTDLNLEIGTGVTVAPAPITNPHRKNEARNCLFENLEHRHGEIVPSNRICVLCMCYYGEVVCSTEKCPPLKIGCRRIKTEKVCCGKIVCVEADESPTVVLDRVDATAPSHHQPMVSPDPFRDVIKTEPAPDLPSLIVDMIPYLVEHRITTPRPASTTTLMPSKNQGSNTFDFIEKVSPLKRLPYIYKKEQEDKLLSKNKYETKQEEQSYTNDSFVSNNYNFKEPENQTLVQMSPPDIESSDKMSANIEYTTKGASSDSFIASNETKLNSTKSTSKDKTSFLAGSKIDEATTIEKANDTNNIQSTTTKGSEHLEEEDIFSLDSVFDLLFSSDTMSNPKSDTISTSEVPSFSTTEEDQSISTTESTNSVSKNSRKPSFESDNSSKILENEIPVPVASLLKLAGCNIYGRMYRVGRIITELSGPCLECRCTEVGVQCKQLKC